MDKQSDRSDSSSQSSDNSRSRSHAIEVPTISLPKGGGAIKGIDEKFTVNAVNGTASLSIPLPVSEARALTPSLSLSYNSGSGNSAFGLGWSLGLPTIKRKTDKALPRYLDAIDSDVFLFSEAEDLVPEYRKEEDGDFSKDADGDYIIHERDSSDGLYVIRSYIPRIEGLFARIERWTQKQSREIRWRVITKENVTTLFGWTSEARVSDPQDESKIFEWFPEFVFDDKGNCTRYIYKREDDQGFDPSLLHNRNRQVNGELTYTGLYLSQILYGNKTPYKHFGDPFPEKTDFMFETAFDYGEYDTDAPYEARAPWAFRQDAFSDFKAGFEIRTTRLCRRVLLFHHLDEYDGLVRSIDLEHDDSAQQGLTFLQSVTSYGYIKDDDGSYSHKNLPPMEFTYQQHEWDSEVKSIASKELVHAPTGLSGSQYQFIDLFEEGLSGILSEQAGGWYYKHNLGGGRFEEARLVSPKPSFTGLGRQLQLTDLDADGCRQLTMLASEPKGYHELDDEGNWLPFIPFESIPNIDLSDPNSRMLDLNGDGRPDILITEDNVFVWYESLGRKGFSGAQRVTHSFDEEKAPRVVFDDATQSIFLADMSGDGLTDIVRIRNSEISYWPNLGYGRFGAKISMDDAPIFDHSDAFNPAYIRIADIDGSGTPDIIYLGKDRFTCWMNLSGNRFARTPFEIDAFPEIDGQSMVTVTDLLGNGVACVVWSSPLQKDANAPLKYVDLMKSKKPHVMRSYKNNLGKEVSFSYAPSTKFYLADKAAGKPWVTKLHFPVHVVEKTTVTDRWEKSSFVTSYSYHHGYYDHREREFRGFGRVEQVDVETFGAFAAGNVASPYISEDKTLYQPPVKTVTWFHTGAYLGRERILSQFKSEYFPSTVTLPEGFVENDLPEPDLSRERLSTEEWPEALRACKGMMLRQEIYELDVDDMEAGIQAPVRLFSTAYHNCTIQRLQPLGANRHAIFLSTKSEAMTYHYELDLRQAPLLPDPRIEHALNLYTDVYGNVCQSVAVVYPRLGRHEDASLPEGTEALIAEVQQERHLVYTETDHTEDIIEEDHLRLRLPYETRSYEVTGVIPQNSYFSLEGLRQYRLSEKYQATGVPVEPLDYHKLASGASPQKRLIEHSRILYFDEKLRDPLPLGKHDHLALPYETYTLALTDDLLTVIFGTKIDDAQMDLSDEEKSGYLSGADLASRFPNTTTTGQYWIRSGIAGFADDAADHFYLPEKYTDAFGNVTTLEFDEKDLYIKSSQDALGNTVEVTRFDYRVLAPTQMRDINDNLSEIAFDTLGMPSAMALKGKGDEADTLSGYIEDGIDIFTRAYDEDDARSLLGDATARYLYDFGASVLGDAITYAHRPAGVATIMREQHKSVDTPLQVAFEYSDGGGKVLVKKVQAEPEKGSTVLRWIANGKTILNNKGKPVKQFEPYFSTDEQRFEELREVGVTPIIYYDAMGRVIRTRSPDGSFSRVEFTPWHVITYDQNDTVLEPGHDWYALRSAATASSEEQRAARLTAFHHNTPTSVFLDTLGRDVIKVEHNRLKDESGVTKDEKYVTFTRLDAEGKPLWIRDARGNVVMRYTVPKEPQGDPLNDFTPCYDIAGNLLFQHSMDGGDRWLINDAADKPFYAWDLNDRIRSDKTQVIEERLTHLTYDALHRPLTQELRIDEGAWQITERFIYGEGQPDDKLNNLRGQLYRHYDPSGRTTQVSFDFKGALLRVQRQLVSDRKAEWTHWSDAVLTTALDPEVFYQESEYDALGRMRRQYGWYSDPDRVSVYEPHYNQRGILESESLTIGVKKGTNGHIDGEESTPVSDIVYDAKGQRLSIRHGNGTRTRYEYDPLTFRLRLLRTTRTDYAPPFPDHHSVLRDDNVLQQLGYTYDAVGNITEILDEAYEPVFFDNQMVEPKSQYEYDALYRLVSATGREDKRNKAPQRKEEPATTISKFPAAQMLRNYRQTYQYDAVGNIRKMRHFADQGNWTRHHAYADDSNRLSKTWLGSDDSDAIIYDYDIHGSMLNLGNIPDEYKMRWDHRDMIKAVDLGGGGWVYYDYDSEKERSRKYIERQKDANGNQIIEERLYLGGMEIYRRWKKGQDDHLRVLEEIETHHLFVDEQRVLMVEDVLVTDKRLPLGTLFRYQYSNHLGSSALELDDGANIISYEEYHPYGTSAYRLTDKDIKATAKRYRYSGMERDEETGLNYHSARYYMPWLGRWLSCDPIGVSDDINLYKFVRNNPINLIDFDGMSAGSYQQYFNKKIAQMILSSGNKKLIDRTLKKTISGYKLNTKRSTGFNAGHYASGDRVTSNQQIAVEFAKQNQLDGSQLEKPNPGMRKSAVIVEIGNGKKIPIERYTARALEIEGVLPKGTSDLPDRPGWRRTELDSALKKSGIKVRTTIKGVGSKVIEKLKPLSRRAGAIGTILGAFFSVSRVANASDTQRSQVIGEEIGSFVGGAVGTIVGSAAAVFALGLMFSNPAGWAVGITAFLGGVIGGIIFGEVGKRIGAGIGINFKDKKPKKQIINTGGGGGWDLPCPEKSFKMNLLPMGDTILSNNPC